MRKTKKAKKLVKEVIKPSVLELKNQKIAELKREVRFARREAAQLWRQLDFLKELGRPVITKIARPTYTSKTQATAVLVASDWHVEEIVDPRTVSGLNKYNPGIAKKRAETFFQIGERLTDVISRDLNLDTIVLALLGDFITGEIHEENAGNNAMPPMEAAIFAQDLIASGIDYLLNASKRKLIIECHVGNHSRITRKQYHATEKGHSIEWMMYCNLVKRFQQYGRVEFRIADGYHSWLNMLNVNTRFHHGHDIRYKGGVGGITIPVNKAIAQWDIAKRADLDIFAHFHQYIDGGKWFCNGSLIGYNPFAVSIKANYEPPRQGFMVIDKKRGRTYTAPIYVER